MPGGTYAFGTDTWTGTGARRVEDFCPHLSPSRSHGSELG